MTSEHPTNERFISGIQKHGGIVSQGYSGVSYILGELRSISSI